VLAGLQSGENKAQHEITVLSTSTLADKASFEARVAIIKATMAELRAHTRDLELLAEEQDTCALPSALPRASKAPSARRSIGCRNGSGCLCHGRCFEALLRLCCYTEPCTYSVRSWTTGTMLSTERGRSAASVCPRAACIMCSTDRPAES